MKRDPLHLKKPNPVIQKRDKSGEIRLDLQRKEALDLALQYVPVREIATKFGKSPSTIYDWLELEHDKLRQANMRMATIYKQKINQQYDDLVREWAPVALALTNDFEVSGTKMVKGKPVHIQLEKWEAGLAATDRLLKILKQQSDLHGLLLDNKKPVGEDKSHEGNLQLIQIVQTLVQQPQLPASKIIEAEVINSEIAKTP